MAAVSGLNRRWARERLSTSRFRQEEPMNIYNSRPIEILLVEDSPADAGLAVEALKEAHIANNLTVVEDGEQAMDFLYKRGKYSDVVHPDLILLDLNLPRKDGREVLKEIKSDPNLKRIP